MILRTDLRSSFLKFVRVGDDPLNMTKRLRQTQRGDAARQGRRARCDARYKAKDIQKRDADGAHLSMIALFDCVQRVQLQWSLSGVEQLNLEHIRPRSSPGQTTELVRANMKIL
jgi:hypothetical protein